MCGCNLGCRRRRRPSGLRLVAITCIVVRMMVNSRRHQGRKAYAPTRRGIIINRAVSASLAALRAMPPGSRPMLSGTKGGLRPGAARGCDCSHARLRRCADAPRDRSAIAERRFARRRCATACSRRAARSQPVLACDPSSEYARASAAKLRPALQWLRGRRSRTRVPSVPHDCRLNAAVLRLTRRGEIAERRSESCARLRRRGCGARVRPRSKETCQTKSKRGNLGRSKSAVTWATSKSTVTWASRNPP
jgi:hypothetical protein